MKSKFLHKMRAMMRLTGFYDIGKTRSNAFSSYISVLSLCLVSINSSAQNYNVTTTPQCNNVAGGNEIVNFTGVTPDAIGNGTVTWYFRGDLDASTEYADLYGEGSGPILGTTTSSTTGISNTQCNVNYDSIVVPITMADINNWASDGTITFTVDASSGVSANLCYSPAVAYCVYMRLEYPRASGLNDIGIAGLDSPLTFCAGNQDIWVTVKNFGLNQVDTFTVNWTWNGIAQTPLNLYQLLDTAQGSNPTFLQVMLGTKTITDEDTLVVWTSNPNNGTDTTNYNDTITRVLAPALTGNYTINSAQSTSGTNFQSFTDLATALTDWGVCGQVTVDVATGSGPYNERFSLPFISGSSSTNTITINGNGATISNLSTIATERGIISFNGTKHVTISNLIIDGYSTSTSNYAYGVSLTNGADSNIITGNTIVLDSNTTSTNFAGIVISGSPSDAVAAGSNADGNIISSNTVIGGYYGITLMGNAAPAQASDNQIINNTVRNFYIYGIYSSNTFNTLIQGNDFSRPTRTSLTTFAPIYLPTGGGKLTVNANKIHDNATASPNYSHTMYGVYLTASTPSVGNENIISNNIMYNLTGIGTHYGFYNSASGNTKYYHNTVLMDYAGAASGANYGFYQTSSASGIEFKNNNIVITKGGSGAKYGIYKATAASPIVADNNNYYINSPVASTNNIGYSTSAQSTLAAWQSASGQDANSHTTDPLFASSSTLIPTNSMLDDLGTPVGINTDITGAPRSATTPDIGAYEFSVPPCAGFPVAGIAAANATSVCPGGPVIVTLTGFTIGAGISIQWEESPAGANMWLPITGATSATLNHTQSTAMDYRALVTCSNGGFTDVSNTVSIGMNPFYFCYCSPLTATTLHSSPQNYITAVSITATPLSVTTSAVAAGGYTLHDPSIPTNTASLTQAQTYTLNASITNAGYASELWIDWDQSGTFDATEYIALPLGTSISQAITVPVTAIPGMTGMRIRNVASTTTLFGASGACNNISVGRETEDFVITIAPAVQCAGVPSTGGTASISIDSICYGGSTELAVQGYPTELGLAFQWEESPAGQNNWSPITGATGFTATVNNITASMDYRIAITCTNPGGGTAYSNTVSIYVNDPQVLSTTPGSRCGTGTVDLSAVPTTGNTIKWYDVATGGQALASGNNFTTPTIGNTTTYYAAASTMGGANGSMPMPAHGSNYTGNVRGFYFTAPVSFTITGLQALAPTTGAQSLAVVKFDNNTPPPIYSATTNAFTLLYLNQNDPNTGVIPVSIAVNAGDVIGVFGQVSNVTSYATPAGPYVSNIAGHPVTLTKMGMQFPLNTTAPQDLWEETATAIGRVHIEYVLGCEGARVPVVATVNPATAITASATDDSVCLGSSTTLNVASANTGYTYTWNPGGSGSSLTVSPTATTTYVVNAIDASNCTATDTLEIAVISAPASVTTIASKTTVCVSDLVDFELDPEPMTGITYQWQKDAGTGFTNIPGATAAMYSETITAAASYQAQMFCDNNLVGTSSPVSINYSNPSPPVVFPGSRCDAGPVTLAAIADSGATINWYTAATGGSSIAIGGAFTTPSISSTTTYYVSASDGGGMTTAGRPAPPSGATGYSSGLTTPYWGLIFDVTQTFTLKSVEVYPTSTTAGNVTIELTNGAGTVLQSAGPFALPAGTGTTVALGATPVTLNLNFTIPPGTDYRLRTNAQSGNLIRENPISGYSYPLPIANVGSITSGMAGSGTAYPTTYYYFYNWQIVTGCESARVPVAATINGTTSGTGLSTGGTTTGTLQADGTTVNYVDGCGDMVATITDAPGGNTLGVTSAIVITPQTVQTHNNLPYVPRIFDLTPASPGAATVTVYALQSEFNAYNSYVTSNSLGLPLLPTGPTDAAGMANIVITQFHGSALDSNTGPGGLYDNTNASFIPNSSITTTWTGNYWSMTFPVSAFSGFFIHSGNTPLEIDLKSITAANFGARNRVDWMTAKEDAGDYFILERSADSRNFTELATVNGRGTASSYSYWDEQPITGKNYYRLKMMDGAGRFSYSQTVTAVMNGNGAFAVEAYPNPVSDLLTVELYGEAGNNATITIADVTGKTIRVVNVTDSKTVINMGGLAQGMYLVKYADDLRTETLKVNKH